VESHPEVYVIGDLARVAGDQPTLPMTAPVAIQQGAAAAQNIARQVARQLPLPFQYHDPGTMVTLGRNAAVVYLGGQTFTGFLAWVVWLGVHIFNLIGFRNRLLVLLDWAWDYLFYERAVRLILPGAESGPGLRTPPTPESGRVRGGAPTRTQVRRDELPKGAWR